MSIRRFSFTLTVLNRLRVNGVVVRCSPAFGGSGLFLNNDTAHNPSNILYGWIIWVCIALISNAQRSVQITITAGVLFAHTYGGCCCGGGSSVTAAPPDGVMLRHRRIIIMLLLLHCEYVDYYSRLPSGSFFDYYHSAAGISRQNNWVNTLSRFPTKLYTSRQRYKLELSRQSRTHIFLAHANNRMPT